MVEIFVISIVLSLAFVSAFIIGSYFGNRRQIIYIEQGQTFKQVNPYDITSEQEVKQEFEKFASKYGEEEEATIISNSKEVETDKILKMFSEIDTER